MKNNRLIIDVRFKIASLKQALSYAERMNLTDEQVNQLLDNLKDLLDLLRILENDKNKAIMETTVAPVIDINQLLSETKALIEDGKDFLLSQGKILELSEWITIAEYSKKHSVSTQVISQWISRGVIPDNSVIDIPELGKKLVRDTTYRS